MISKMTKEAVRKDMGKFAYTNKYGDIATIEYNGSEWFVDMNCALWNRYYKRFHNALNYVTKNGYK